MTENDELKIYRGEDFIVSKYIKIHQPSINEICEYGERKYYQMVHHLTATPQSIKWQLWDVFHTDYTTLTPYELFYSILYSSYSQEKTSIIFGDLDFTKFKLVEVTDINGHKSIKLYQNINGEEVYLDELTYNIIVDYLREVHSIQKDEKMPANESTKMALIEDDRDAYLLGKDKEYHSQLKNMISAMINCEGFKYSHSQVWNMKINAFMDSVKRILKIKNADLLLQSAYSGFGVNLNDVPDKDKKLDWLGGLD